MRDHRREVEAALQHRDHLVPGLEHLAPVDALDLEALEDHLVPVDRHLRRRNPEERDLAAVVHALEHVGKGRGHARHLEADVEALGHAELRHHVAELRLADVDRARRAHSPREVEPVVVDVGDHDVARADVPRDRRRHDADRPGAGDEHVLADQVERQRRVRRVAERVEDRRDLVGDVVRNLERVERRDHEIFGERAFAVDADADRVAAQMPAARAAVAAEAAGDMPFAGDAVADREAADLLPQLDDFAHVFVADVHRHRDRLLRPVVPLPDMDVGAADRGLHDPDHHVVVADFGLLHVGQREARRALEFGKCFHSDSPLPFNATTPSARPTRPKASIARSICAAVCAALICVRIRALPFGTTG